MHEKRPKINWALWPASILYKTGVYIRNKLFDWGMLHSRTFSVPVVCVGNLTVGGTGKTPHTEYLIRLLREQFKVATLSRGYKRKTKGFVLSSASSMVEDIGDEPFQMARKFPDILVAVDEDRCEGIERLMKVHAPFLVDVVLLDDAFQHRYVKPGLSVLLVDYNRPVYADRMLPAGRLREPANGKKRADIVIVTKCPSDLQQEEQNLIRTKLNLLPHQSLFFTTMKYGTLHPLFTDAPERPLDSLEKKEKILLLTGIASPEGLKRTLETHCDEVSLLAFPDHHAFGKKDLLKVEKAFKQMRGDKRMIVTTEKDAARLIAHDELDGDIKPFIYTLPIEVKFLNNEESTFNQKIIEYVRKNPRNSSIHQS